MNQKFPKEERLKCSKTIENLFLEGKTYSRFPVKVFFLPKEGIKTHLAAFAVPKRNFKSAVDRNRIKRQLRDVYRLNKNILPDGEKQPYIMLFLFLGKVKPKYRELERSMIGLLQKISE